VALQRDDTLRTRFVCQISQYRTDQLVFVDESASNERTAERKWGWSIRGDPCRVRRNNKRSKRWSILPAITVDGYIAYEIYQDSFTKERFNRFIRQDLLPIMQPYPLPCSVLIMDNHSIHRSEELSEMCDLRGVILLYLPPYSPDLNPIEQSFGQLKSWMRRNQRMADLLNGHFETFIRMAIRRSMGDKGAWGHFRACGYGLTAPQQEDDTAGSDSDNSLIDTEF
jgi:transposase